MTQTPREVLCLIFISLLLLLGWIPGTLAKWKSYGLSYLLTNRELPPPRTLPAWGGRAERAYQNLQDYYPPFLASVLLLLWAQRTDSHTALAATVFVAARFLHFAVYLLGWPLPRTFFWLMALLAQVFLYVKILSLPVL